MLKMVKKFRDSSSTTKNSLILASIYFANISVEILKPVKNSKVGRGTTLLPIV